MAETLEIVIDRSTIEIVANAIPSSAGTVGADLTAIEALTGTGAADRTAANTWTLRSTGATGILLLATTTPGAARAILGVEFGTDVQPFDADLAALAALATTGIARRTGASTWTVGTTVSVAEGGTGATTEAAARTALGLAIGTDVQAYDAELAALAGLVSAADRLPYFTGLGTAALATFTAAGRAILDDADATAQRTTLGLVIGTNVQAWDADLDALAAVGSGMLARTGAGTAAARTVTAGTGIGVTNGDGVAGNPTISVVPGQTTVAAGTTQTNLDLTGYSDVRLAPTASHMVTSIVAEAAGTVKVLRNVGTYPVLMVIASSLGTAANRLQSEDVGSGTHMILLPGDVARVTYDGTDSRWTVTPVRVVDDRWTMRQWLPSTGTTILATTLPFSGSATNTAVPTTASYLASKWRFRLVTAASAANIVGINAAAGGPRSIMSNGTGLGGFAVRVGFGMETEPDALASVAIGFTFDTSAGVGNDYDQLTDFLGFELNPNDANWHWMNNDGAGVATRVNLGAGFPRTAGVWLRGYIYADPYVSSRVSYAVWREDDVTQTPVVGDVTTDLPTTNPLGGFCHICNRTSSLSHGVSFDEITNWTPT